MGDAGNDTLLGEDGNDLLLGGPGIDFLYGGPGNDTLESPGAGFTPDFLSGGDGDDLIFVDALTDTVDGGAGNDTIVSSVAGFRNFINVEFFFGPGGVQIPVPTNGADNLTGTTGNDTIDGLAGDDTIDGGAGDDSILGGADADSIIAGSGVDTIVGGSGTDTLTGGDGADQFVFNSPTEGVDSITDFVPTQDSIRILASGFGGSLVAGTFLPAADFVSGPGANAPGDGTDRFIYNTTTGELRFDPDGTGPQPTVLLAVLAGSPALANTNIVIF